MSTIHHTPPKVSIIVPVYNQQRYVKKCLNSILQQTYRETEVIVVNDGSTDNSLSIINQMAKEDARVIVIDKANEGLPMARNDGLKKVTGEYVMFVDSDDWITPPEAISAMVGIAQREDVDIVIGKSIRHFPLWERKSDYMPALETNRKITTPELFDKYYVSFFGINIFPVQAWAKLYKASLIAEAAQQVSLFEKDIVMGEDEHFIMQLFPYTTSFYASDLYVYKYRYGGMTSYYNPRLGELFHFGDKRLPLLDRYQYEKGYQPLFIEYKNVLRDYIAQQIAYKKATREEIMTWLAHELDTRYLVKRMRAYYEHHECPPSLLHIMEGNAAGIYQLALDSVLANRKRHLAKQALARLQRVFRFLQ